MSAAAEAVNPWLAGADDGSCAGAGEEPGAGEPRVVPAARWVPGAEVAASAVLPAVEVPAGGPGLFVVGAHGGAGATVLAGLLGAGDAGTAWPVPTDGSRVRVVVAARTSARGIEAARDAAVQWAGAGLPGVDLVGVVWVPAAPGRLPRALRQGLELASGAFPYSTRVPWVGAWVEGAAAAVPRGVRRALAGLAAEREEEPHDD